MTWGREDATGYWLPVEDWVWLAQRSRFRPRERTLTSLLLNKSPRATKIWNFWCLVSLRRCLPSTMADGLPASRISSAPLAGGIFSKLSHHLLRVSKRCSCSSKQPRAPEGLGVCSLSSRGTCKVLPDRRDPPRNMSRPGQKPSRHSPRPIPFFDGLDNFFSSA